MSTQMPPEEPQARQDEQESPAWTREIDAVLAQLDWPVWIGRIFGSLIVVGSLAVGIKAATDARNYGFWVFLAAIMVPMGIGFLILVVSEVLNRLRRTPQ